MRDIDPNSDRSAIATLNKRSCCSSRVEIAIKILRFGLKLSDLSCCASRVYLPFRSTLRCEPKECYAKTKKGILAQRFATAAQ
ncbi:hypothetical protein C7B80_33105 [Cyanosarcina cf. burmensis CCALA 770]|nr:hypothetical protein C7B80_33105 [Cyanosarcina cf. burmensis CCALA 770]